MKKYNFTTVEQMRDAIIDQHRKDPNVIILISDSTAMALNQIAKIGSIKKGRRMRVIAIEYDGGIQSFFDSKKKLLFLLQEKTQRLEI